MRPVLLPNVVTVLVWLLSMSRRCSFLASICNMLSCSLCKVNHLSKRHPDMKIEEVPELTLPIIKPNRDYFCQYCDKVCKEVTPWSQS